VDGVSPADLDFDTLISREWLITNGIGGYASSTLPGLNTRRYHGLLIAAMAPPVRRHVLLSRVEETVVWTSGHADLACNEYPGAIFPRGDQLLRAFSYEPHPRWAYQSGSWTLEKQVRLVHGENTVVLTYTLLGAERPVDLEVRPLFALRPIHELTYQGNGRLAAKNLSPGHYQVSPTSRSPEVFFASSGHCQDAPCWYLNTIYRRERERGYAGLEDLWSPGVVHMKLMPGEAAHFVCSADPIVLTETVRKVHAQTAASLKVTVQVATGGGEASPDPSLDALRRAANAFPISLHRGADESSVPACVTGYHWFAPSARATLIAFSGLYLVTGRFEEARNLLLEISSHLKNGLLPTDFSEDGDKPLYHGADVSLWFVAAVFQYLRYSGDDTTVRRQFLDVVMAIIDAYRKGTDLGIHTDFDGLLTTGASGIPTTWMDAKAGDWVVTPRAGRAVEINALWYNALCIAADLAEQFEKKSVSVELVNLARSVQQSFNKRFWNEFAGCCFDVIGDQTPDASIRPNQVLAMSLPFPVLKPDRCERVLETLRRDLLTPYGLRTLSPRDVGYVGHYSGGVVARDRAYHNGTAFTWLLGPYVSAMLRVTGRGAESRQHARSLLQHCIDRLQGDGLGLINELFDGDFPHAPGGIIACPMATGELLRCYVEDILDRAPAPSPSSSPVTRSLDLGGVSPRFEHRNS
jgi:predicted glycogen debranching enzyme